MYHDQEYERVKRSTYEEMVLYVEERKVTVYFTNLRIKKITLIMTVSATSIYGGLYRCRLTEFYLSKQIL